MKTINVAAGKEVNNTSDFCKVFGDLDVEKKAAVIKNMNKTLDTGISNRGTHLKEDERGALKQLIAWAGVNLLVGNELCPPETLNTY